jgi:hypothetical protein
VSSIAPSVRQRIPNSPPPSFHSRASSQERRRQAVDPTLADAFDTDGDDSDDEPDDRQRLVRQSSFPVSIASMSPAGSSSAERPAVTARQATQWPSTSNPSNAQASRIYGGGIQSDGVFSNIMARPERGEKVVEEQPPVCIFPYRQATEWPVSRKAARVLTTVSDIRTSRRGCRTPILGDDHSRARPRWSRRGVH